MKIEMRLSEKSIKEAITALKRADRQLNKMAKDLLLTCCTWIYDRANQYVMASDIGENVKINIIRGWQAPELTVKNGVLLATLRNTDEQAVYVEFGVGIVGAEPENMHPKANEEHYQYNVGGKINPITNQWIFNVSSDEDIDIQAEFIDKRTTNTVKTKGSPAVMYAYNAVVDLREFALKQIWQEIKVRYWG